MRVLAAKMCVAYTFEVVRQAKVEAIVCQGGIYPVRRCLIYCRSGPEPCTYLHLRGRVGVLFSLLVSPSALRLGGWGDAFLGQGCFQYLAAGRCGWRLGIVWRCEPHWEGDQFRTKITCQEIPLQALEFFNITCCRRSNA